MLEKVVPDSLEVGKSLLGGLMEVNASITWPLTSGRICAATELAILFMLWSTLSPSLPMVSWAPSCKQGTVTSWCALTSTIFVCRGGHTCCLSWPMPFTRCVRTLCASLRLSYCPTHYRKFWIFLLFYKTIFVLYDFAAICLFNLQYTIHTTYWNYSFMWFGTAYIQ